MPWRIINARDRELVVCGDSAGVATFTREPRQALEFPTPDAARNWIATKVISEFGQLALHRVNDDAREARRPSHYSPRRA